MCSHILLYTQFIARAQYLQCPLRMEAIFRLIRFAQPSENTRSVAMEKEGLRWSLNYLLERDVSINTIDTDRHRGVGALMKTYITHQYDVWHMVKSMVTQLTQKDKLKHCERLLPWIQSISNYLWWAALTCNGDAQLLTESGPL